MIVCFEKIHNFSKKNVEFFTVKIGNKELTEFEYFLQNDFPNHADEEEILFTAIEQIQERGAKRFFFKDESNANALPVVPQAIMDANKLDYGIRLYAIRLTDELVVLLNGGIKTELDPTACDNVKTHFKNALKIATKLDKLRLDNDIDFTEFDSLKELEIEI